MWSDQKESRHGESNTRRLWFYGPFEDCYCCGHAIQHACFLSRTPVVESCSASPLPIWLDRSRCLCLAPASRIRRMDTVSACGVTKRSLDTGNRTPVGCGFTDLLKILVAASMLYSMPFALPDTSRRVVQCQSPAHLAGPGALLMLSTAGQNNYDERTRCPLVQ